MLLELAAERRVLFWRQGWRRQTTVAAATALARARAGRRVLLVSTDPAHNPGTSGSARWARRRCAPGGRAGRPELDPELTVQQHLEDVGAALRKLMPAQPAKDTRRCRAMPPNARGGAARTHRRDAGAGLGRLRPAGVRYRPVRAHGTADGAAGNDERSTEGLLRRQERGSRFSRVEEPGRRSRLRPVHTGQNDGEAAPDRDSRIRQILDRRRERFNRLREVLGDAQQCAFVIVLAAERLPVLETIELHAQLQRAGTPVGALVVNKRRRPMPAPFSPNATPRGTASRHPAPRWASYHRWSPAFAR